MDKSGAMYHNGIQFPVVYPAKLARTIVRPWVHSLGFTLLLPVDTPLGHRYAVSFRNLS